MRPCGHAERESLFVRHGLPRASQLQEILTGMRPRSRPSITFRACGNTQENMAKAENKKIPLVSQATVVKSGVVRVMELQEQGWSYLRP